MSVMLLSYSVDSNVVDKCGVVVAAINNITVD